MTNKFTYFFLFFFTLLLAQRCFHLGGEIDLPHDWRQSETAWISYDFLQNGIDILHPTVCWMGKHQELVLECPLPEAIVALAFQFTGESMPVARIIYLSIFLFSLYYFYRIAEFLYDEKLAQIATIAFLGLPLSYFYSRAIHIDFSALGFSFAFFYYYLLAVKHKKTTYLWLSSAFAIVAFLIKIPYAFYFALPMLVFTWQHQRLKWVFSQFYIYIPPVTIFILWRIHSNTINAAAPDWNFILHYRKFVNNTSWYFGSLAQRLQLYSWKILLQRGLFDVAGLGGILFLGLGLWRNTFTQMNRILLMWTIGIILYVLIFFNLNFIHNYYQIPLLPIAAIWIALGLKKMLKHWPKILIPSLFFIIIINGIYTEVNYYSINQKDVEIGAIIRENTTKNDLIIISTPKMDCRNPKILYRSRRRGWSIEYNALNKSVIQELHANWAADYWVYIGEQPPLDIDTYLKSFTKMSVFSLNHHLDRLFLYQFKKSE